jgi:hypothetical protein
MVFLLTASFLKSTKGGEGFRKLSLVRNGQNIPFSTKNVDDFSDVSLFTILPMPKTFFCPYKTFTNNICTRFFFVFPKLNLYTVK